MDKKDLDRPAARPARGHGSRRTGHTRRRRGRSARGRDSRREARGRTRRSSARHASAAHRRAGLGKRRPKPTRSRRSAPSRRSHAIGVGAIVEIEDDERGEGRTFFLAPAGAGITLTGPGGDGVLSVVTPASPIGKAVIGRRAGEVVDITVDGELREWQITYVA